MVCAAVAISPSEFTIEAKANVAVTYEIEESAKEWIVAGESRALTTKTLKFNAKANEKDEPRQGIITLKGGDGLTETVTIYQEGEKPALVITSNDVIVGSEGETIKIELKSNVDYTMVLPNVDWISQAESRTISAYTHYLTIAPNESYDQRDAMVYVNNETEGLKDSISITQLQLDAIIVAKNEYEIDSEGGQLEFKVSSNVDFKISTSANWIRQNTGSRGPLGTLTKQKVRSIAQQHGIVTAHKQDSQDICFVPDGKYADFIKQYTGKTYPPGDFVDRDGNILGTHKGIIHYTIGQRRGLEIAAGKRQYVCSIDTELNCVVLGQDKDLYTKTLIAKNINLISLEVMEKPMRLKAKVRYRHTEQWATVIQLDSDTLRVSFDEPQRAVPLPLVPDQ